MADVIPTNSPDIEYQEAQKRVQKIKKFYKNLAEWAGVSIFLLALNFFLVGSITWAKYPVFFWGISLVIKVFEIIRLQRMDKNWEERQMRRFTGRTSSNRKTISSPDPQQENLEDYSEELLHQQDRELENLSEYRTLNRPWKDEDLV